MIDEDYMRLALSEAQAAFDEGEIPVGAVVVNKGRVIARAITSAATLLGGKYLTDCTLYVTVEPCTMCAGALGWAQVARVVYGASDPKRGYTCYAPHALHPKASTTSGILEKECTTLMQEFFRLRR